MFQFSKIWYIKAIMKNLRVNWRVCFLVRICSLHNLISHANSYARWASIYFKTSSGIPTFWCSKCSFIANPQTETGNFSQYLRTIKWEAECFFSMQGVEKKSDSVNQRETDIDGSAEHWRLFVVYMFARQQRQLYIEDTELQIRCIYFEF